MTLGERLKDYRKREGLSQEQLAEALNVSRQAITKWESDRGVPDIDNLIAISKLAGVSLDELILGEARISHEAAKARKDDITIHLIAAASFFVAFLCWIISGCLNLGNRNAVSAVLNFASAFLCMLAALFQIKKFFARKEQGK